MTVIAYDPLNDNPTVLIKFPANETYDRKTYSLMFKVNPNPKEACERYIEALQELMIVDKDKVCQCASQMDLYIEKISTRG